MKKAICALFCIFSLSIQEIRPEVFESIETYSNIEWNIIHFVELLKAKIRRFLSSERVATARVGCELSNEEIEFLVDRTYLAKHAIEQHIGLKLNDSVVPTVALCMSGGGYRAMIGALGSLIGAEEAGLLPTISYACAVSGSTWFLAPWITSGLDLKEYKETLIPKVEDDLKTAPIDIVEVTKVILRKYIFNQKLSLIDLYGAFVANKLLEDFGNKKFNIGASILEDKVESRRHPFPIFSAISQGDERYQWLEFTPYEIGGKFFNASIPIWGLGRKYEHGNSVDYTPEQSLGFCLGVFGSAFSASFHEIYEEFQEKVKPEWLSKLIRELMVSTGLHETRISIAEVNNFTYNLSDSPTKNEDQITMFDAGIDMNLPFPSVMRNGRDVDIILVLDNSDRVLGAPSLARAEKWAHANDLNFPKIDYENIDNKTISIFEGENCPTIIYMQLINSADNAAKIALDSKFNHLIRKDFDPIQETKNGYCSKYNFKYSETQLRELSGLTEFNMISNSDQIWDAIKRSALKKANRLRMAFDR